MGVLDPFKDAFRAASLDVSFYNEIEFDRAYTPRAFLVVLVGWTAIGIGNFLVEVEWATAAGILWSALAGTVGWVVWSALALVIGTRVFKGTADMGQMLRVLGFAQVPLVIGVVPGLDLVGYAWALVASVFAVREGLDFTTPSALATVAIGWAAVGAMVLVVLWLLR